MKWFKVTFFYKGKEEEFIVKSLNKAEAIADSKKTYKGILVKIEEIPIPFEERMNILKDLIATRIMRKKLKYPAYISALRQLSVLIKAGISIKDALEDIANNTLDPLIKEVFIKSAEAIDSGKNLSEVFGEYEEYLGGLSVAMIRLGEQTGDLAMAIDSLADIYENMYENRRKMIKALRYPIITLIAIVVAFVFLILLVVPKFKAIFEQLHAELPLPTRILLNIEYVLTHYGLLVLSIVVSFIIANIYFYKTSKEFKYKMDKILLKTYLIGNIINYASLNRFLQVLASLLKSGIPLLDALKIAEGIIANEILKEKIRRIISGINQGRNLAEMMTETQLVNFIALRMISAGESSGELESMLQSAANYYSDRFQDIIENMQASIEPIMLTIIGGLVLLLALGIFLPMWDMANAARGG